MAHPHAASRLADDRLLATYRDDPGAANLETLVERYRPLARSLAHRYLGGSEPFEDLLQVADLGLVKAIQGYDPDRNTSFSAYAVPTILGELRRHFRDRVWNLRLPRALQESTLAIDVALGGLTEELGREPTVAELAERTGLTEEIVSESLIAREVRWTMSIDAPLRADDDAGATRVELISREELGYDRVEADYACSTAILDAREREILELRFDTGLTQAEIGSRLGISQMQVSRVSRRALVKLLTAVQGGGASPLIA
jgi:RNA polymerase sigma-B factor